MADAEYMRACAECGCEFAANVNMKDGALSKRQSAYCGKRCSYRARDRGRRSRRSNRSAPVACHGCGVTVVRSIRITDSNNYCARTCYLMALSRVKAECAALQRIGAAWRRSAKRIQALESQLTKLRERVRLMLARTCSDCGVEFQQRSHMGSPEIRCGGCAAVREKSLRRIGKAKRRAATRGRAAERIDPIKVLCRDNWRCQMCGVHTPERLRGTCDPRAPELDHVIPLALGGAHSWGNVQCACRQCNQRKGARAIGQLGLPFAA